MEFTQHLQHRFRFFHIFARCNFSCSGLWFYLPSEIHVCCCLLCVVDGTDEKCNFSAVCSPIELKLGGDLGLVSQISVHVLVSRFDYFCPLQL
jgi:hypothetical protein